MDTRQTYLTAATAFADLVERIGDDRWSAPGLGVWNLRDLVGHATNAGLRTVLDALGTPADAVARESPEAYYALARTVDPKVYAAALAAVTEGARRDGESLGDRPAAVVRDLVETVGRRLSDVPLDVVVSTAAGGMTIEAWLPTRTFELVVHGLDIATSSGVPLDVPDHVVLDAAILAVRVAGAVGDATTVLRALTGRAGLPEGFSVV